jgi:ribonuclease HI
MLFKVVDDWKQNLPPEDEARLNDIIRNVSKHRSAFRTSKDVKVAQLWCAVLELRKENQAMYKKMKRLQTIVDGFADVVKKADAEDRSVLESLEKF